MNYVITGGCGFIGSHLAHSLIYSGHKIVVIDDLSSGCIENIEDLLSNPDFTLIENDILSIKNWDTILSPHDVIIHLAATVGVNNVIKNPLQTLNNNYQPTLQLIKIALQYKCKFFFSSTSEIYGELNTDFSCETDSFFVPGSLCGRSAYVLGKILSEQYCMEYSRQFGLPVVIGRFFNIIGPNQVDKFGMVVPTFIRQAANNEPITLYGNGDQTRVFCDISDLISAVKLLLKEPRAFGEIFNIGGNERITIKELGHYIKENLNSSAPLVSIPFPPHRREDRDVLHRSACLKKIQSLTGWEPTTNWQDAVDSIIAHQIIFASQSNFK